MGYFLPYQAKWLADKSRLKIVEKSRRIGLTYVQSYEDVRDAAPDEGAVDVWFSSADESAAKEYILYCGQWAKLLNIAAEDLGEVVIDSDKDIKALVIQFANGKRIHGLSSNPAAFRSKGGKLILDEFAFHKDQEAMWKAAAPIITWGYQARVLSTYNGKGNRYARMVGDAKKGNKWSLHTITIEDAVAQGLVDRIFKRKATHDEIAAFLADCRDIAGDEETYRQEFMCDPVDEASAWLAWDLISRCQHADAGRPGLYKGGPVYVGMDIGRRGDLAVIWVVELVGDVYWTREVIPLKNATFAQQDAALAGVFDRYKVSRLCMDQTGMGEKPVEDAKIAHGEYTVEGVLFSSPVKQALAITGKELFEDNRVRIPDTRAIRDSHHAVRKTATAAGNPRFDADRSEAGHADEFWAHMLALHAADDPVEPWETATVGRDEYKRLTRGY